VTALIAARLLGGMLVHVSVADPLTFAASSVFLGLVAVARQLHPGPRATSAEPMATLRSR